MIIRQNYLIEHITSTDELLLWDMLYLAVYVPPGVSPPDIKIVHSPELSRYVEGWGKKDDLGVKALTSYGQSVGAAWIRLLKGENRGYGYVDDATPELGIAVTAEFRGKGIGTLMMKKLIELAAERYPAISLSVYKDNPAMRLYQRLGFETVGVKGSSLIMMLKIKGTT